MKLSLTTDQLHWNKDGRTFAQELSSLTRKPISFQDGIEILNPKTGRKVQFVYESCDSDGEETSGWWFRSVGFSKELKLLLIND